MSEGPIFILSCERSGSTLLRTILDTHPAVAAPGEVGLGELCNRLLLVLSRTMGQTPEWAGQGPPAPLHDWWAQGRIPGVDAAVAVAEETRRLVDALMGRYARAMGKRIWCAKAAVDLQFADVLAMLFEEGRFLCLYRESLDVAHSCLEISRLGYMRELAPYVIASPLNTLAAMLTSWADKTERLLAFQERHPGRCLRLRYEDLVAEPDRVVSQTLRFLELDDDPGLLERVFVSPHHQGGGDPKILQTQAVLADRVGKGRHLPRHLVGAELRERLQGLHRRLDYPGP